MILELLLIGISIGVMSGFFGIGGGMILTPILLLVGFSMKDAIGISIVQMVFSSIYGSYLNHKRGSLKINDGIFIGIGGFIGGFIGGLITNYLSDVLLQSMFFALLVFATFKLFKSKEPEDDNAKQLSSMLLFVIGFVIGVFAITLGVGGAILITPILVGILHYPMKKAVSASLFFIVFSSIAGMISRLLTGTIDFNNALIVAFASLIGVAIGIKLKDLVNAKNHKIALLVLYMFAMVIIANKLWF